MLTGREQAAIAHHLATIEALRPMLGISFQPAVDLLVGALSEGHKLLFAGNGGSWAQAAHFAAELSVRYLTDRRALAAIALTDSAALTACANDYGYKRVFARQVEALGNPGDALVVLSTSGTSENITEAVLTAKFRGLRTLGLSGERGIRAGCDIDLQVPSRVTASIQEAHALIIHLLCSAIEDRLPKGEDPKWRPTT